MSSDTLITLFTDAPFAICVLKGEELILTASNQLMLDFLDLTDEHIGCAMSDIIGSFSGSTHEKLLYEVLHHGVTHQGFGEEFAEADSENLQEAYYDYTYTPLKDQRNKITGVIITATNVTEQIIARKKLAESEKKLRELIMLSEVPIAVYSGDDLIIDIINDSAKKLWGKDYEVEGMKLEDAIPEMRNQQNSSKLREVLKSGKTYRKDGAKIIFEKEGKKEERFFNHFYKPLRTADGKVESILSMGLDVTAQTLENRLISKNEERLKQFIAAMPMSISILRGENLVMELSNSAISELWEGVEKRKGNTLLELYPEVEGTEFLDVLREAYNTGKTTKLPEYKLYLPGSEKPKYVSYRFTPVDFEGEERMVISVGYEVTEEVLLRKKLYQSDRNFRMLANSIPQILWTANRHGITDYYNEKWYEFTGWKRTESLDKWRELLHPDDLQQAEETWEKSVKTGEEYEIEYRMKGQGKSAQYRWFLVRAVALKDDSGKILKWFGSNTDIQDFKMFQQHKDDFIGITSHELKTPLTSIKLYAQAMERMLNTDENQKLLSFARNMSEQVNRLNKLVTDLVDVTRIQNGQLTLEKTVFDFDELATEVVQMMQMSTDHHKLELKLGNTGSIEADRGRISQVMSNFISNAVKYSPESDRVQIITEVTKNNRVRFCVKDFGIGIKKEHLHKIFEQFYRATEDDLHSYEGMGLGLHISNEIIRRSGGSKHVTSKVGKGSQFSFELPRKA